MTLKKKRVTWHNFKGNLVLSTMVKIIHLSPGLIRLYVLKKINLFLQGRGDLTGWFVIMSVAGTCDGALRNQPYGTQGIELGRAERVGKEAGKGKVRRSVGNGSSTAVLESCFPDVCKERIQENLCGKGDLPQKGGILSF